MASADANNEGNTTDQSSGVSGQMRPGAPADQAFAQAVTWCKGFAWGADIPRRLGEGATREELAHDKKIMRQLAHLYQQLANQWTSRFPYYCQLGEMVISPEDQKFGAQVRPVMWAVERMRLLPDLRGEAQAAADPEVANIVAHRFTFELEGLKRILG